MALVLTMAHRQIEPELDMPQIRQGAGTVGGDGITIGPTGEMVVEATVEIMANGSEKRRLSGQLGGIGVGRKPQAEEQGDQEQTDGGLVSYEGHRDSSFSPETSLGCPVTSFMAWLMRWPMTWLMTCSAARTFQTGGASEMGRSARENGSK